MTKAVSFVVLICDSYSEEARMELEEAVNRYLRRLKGWKIEKVSTLEM